MAHASVEVPAALVGAVRDTAGLLYDATVEALHLALRSHVEAVHVPSEEGVRGRERLADLDALLARLGWRGCGGTWGPSRSRELLVLAHRAAQSLPRVAQLLGPVDQLEGRLTRRLGVALLGRARDVVERGPHLGHGRCEVVALVGEILRRLEILELLAELAEPLCQVVELVRELLVGRALRGLDRVPGLLAQRRDALAQGGEVVLERLVVAVVAAARGGAGHGQGCKQQRCEGARHSARSLPLRHPVAAYAPSG